MKYPVILHEGKLREFILLANQCHKSFIFSHHQLIFLLILGILNCISEELFSKLAKCLLLLWFRSLQTLLEFGSFHQHSNCAMSVISVHLSRTIEKNTNLDAMFLGESSILLVTVRADKLTLGHRMSDTKLRQCLMNSPSVNGFDFIAIFLAMTVHLRSIKR